MVFDPLPKAAYTHGLELIYTLQDVDITSVRVLGKSQSAQTPPKTSVVPFPILLNREEQLEFTFGGGFDCEIPSFSNPSLAVSNVDSADLIRVLISGMDRKKAFTLLEAYQLQDWVDVIPSEALELRKLTAERKEAWAADVMDRIRSQSRMDSLINILKPVFDSYIKPWMHGRLGLATERDLDERWHRIAENPEKSNLTLKFLKDVFAPNDFYSFFLKSLEKGSYADRFSTLNDCESIISCAKKYFKSSACFDLPHLTSLIGRDFAYQWRGFPEGFIEKSLSLCADFRIRKDHAGRYLIKLNLL